MNRWANNQYKFRSGHKQAPRQFQDESFYRAVSLPTTFGLTLLGNFDQLTVPNQNDCPKQLPDEGIYRVKPV